MLSKLVCYEEYEQSERMLLCICSVTVPMQLMRSDGASSSMVQISLYGVLDRLGLLVSEVVGIGRSCVLNRFPVRFRSYFYL